jgi:uncharacterized membrane protein YukC
LGRVLFLDHPVEHEIIFVSHTVKKILEKFAKVTDIRLFFELKAAAIVHINSKLFGITFGQSFN